MKHGDEQACTELCTQEYTQSTDMHTHNIHANTFTEITLFQTIIDSDWGFWKSFPILTQVRVMGSSNTVQCVLLQYVVSEWMGEWWETVSSLSL